MTEENKVPDEQYNQMSEALSAASSARHAKNPTDEIKYLEKLMTVADLRKGSLYGKPAEPGEPDVRNRE
jgi:hypothetical protein